MWLWSTIFGGYLFIFCGLFNDISSDPDTVLSKDLIIVYNKRTEREWVSGYIKVHNTWICAW